MTFTGRAQVRIAWSSAPFSASPAWTDVTPWVRLDRAPTLQRGRQDNISEIQAGRLTLTADNSDGRFTVGLSTSPWAPDVKIGRRIQVNVPDETGTLHTRFDGLITELPTEWEGGPGIEALAVIQASDILSWLTRQPELLSWTQQEMLADSPLALWSLADTSNAAQAADQAGQGAALLQVVSQGDGTGTASAGGGVPLTEVQTTNVVASQQVTTVFTFTNPGPFTWQAPGGTLISCDVACVGSGQGGEGGSGAGGASGGIGGEYAEEPALAVTPGSAYSGNVALPGLPSLGNGSSTTFAGDSVTVTAHGGGTGLTSANTVHQPGGTSPGVGGANPGFGGGSSGGKYQAGNISVGVNGGTAPAGGGTGGTGDSTGAGAGAGAQPGGGGGGGHGVSVISPGAQGGTGQVTITYTYIPLPVSQQNSSLPSWLFTPSATLAARVLQGTLPQPVTAAAGFAFEAWAAFASFPAQAVSTFTVLGAITWTAPPGITAPDVACVAAGQSGINGTGGAGQDGGVGGEYAEEPALAVTPGNVYSGSVGTPGVPSGGLGGNSAFTGDSVTVLAHGSGSGSTNTVHHSGGTSPGVGGNSGYGGGSSGGTYQAGNISVGINGGAAVFGGGAGGGGDSLGTGGAPGAQPGGGGGGGHGVTALGIGGSGGAGQVTVTSALAVSCLLTLVNPRGQDAIAVWVTSGLRLQLASTANYGTRAPTWTTVDAGAVPAVPFTILVSVAPSTRVATLYVGGVSAGTLTLPAGATYTMLTVGGSYGGWLGGWNGSAGLAAVYPAAVSGARTAVHYTAGTTGFAGSSTGTMIAKVAAYTGLPSIYYTPPSGTSDPSYGLTLVSYYDLNGQQPLAQMQLYEQAEAGVLAVNAAGQLTFSDRASRYAAGAAGSAFVLAAGQYEPDTSFKSNDQYLCTRACYATNGIPGGFPVINTAVQPDFGVYPANAGTVKSPQSAPFADAAATAGTFSADDIMDAGWWQSQVFGQPTSRVPAMTVDLFTVAYAPYDLVLAADSPSAWWKLADAAGSGTAADSSGGGHAGTPSSVTFGAPQAVSADTSASFASASSSHVLTSYNPALSAVTIEAWVNLAGLSQSGNPRILANSHTDTDSHGFQLMLSGTTPQVWFGNGSASANVIAAAALPASGWAYLAATWDGTTIRLYVNGAQVATGALTGSLAAGTASGTGIGYNPAYSGDYLNGLIAQCSVYPAALPAARILAHWQGSDQLSLSGFYGCDIGSALQLAGLPSQAPDSTGQPLAAYHVIEGINETIGELAHTAQLYTSPLPQNAAWIPGDALLGVLGTTTVVGRSRAPAALGPPYAPVATFGSTLNRTGSAGAQDMRTLTVNTQNRLTPPLAILQQQSAQTLTTLAGQAVSFDTVLGDTAGGFGALTTYTVQPGFAGYYLCQAVVQAATGTASLGGIAAWFAAVLGGTASQWHARTVSYLSSAPYTAVALAGRIGPCAAGDTIQVIAAAAGTPASLPLGTADGGSMFTLLWQGD